MKSARQPDFRAWAAASAARWPTGSPAPLLRIFPINPYLSARGYCIRWPSHWSGFSCPAAFSAGSQRRGLANNLAVKQPEEVSTTDGHRRTRIFCEQESRCRERSSGIMAYLVNRLVNWRRRDGTGPDLEFAVFHDAAGSIGCQFQHDASRRG